MYTVYTARVYTTSIKRRPGGRRCLCSGLHMFSVWLTMWNMASGDTTIHNHIQNTQSLGTYFLTKFIRNHSVCCCNRVFQSGQISTVLCTIGRSIWARLPDVKIRASLTEFGPGADSTLPSAHNKNSTKYVFCSSSCGSVSKHLRFFVVTFKR